MCLCTELCVVLAGGVWLHGGVRPSQYRTPVFHRGQQCLHPNLQTQQPHQGMSVLGPQSQRFYVKRIFYITGNVVMIHTHLSIKRKILCNKVLKPIV